MGVISTPADSSRSPAFDRIYLAPRPRLTSPLEPGPDLAQCNHRCLPKLNPAPPKSPGSGSARSEPDLVGRTSRASASTATSWICGVGWGGVAPILAAGCRGQLFPFVWMVGQGWVVGFKDGQGRVTWQNRTHPPKRRPPRIQDAEREIRWPHAEQR